MTDKTKSDSLEKCNHSWDITNTPAYMKVECRKCKKLVHGDGKRVINKLLEDEQQETKSTLLSEILKIIDDIKKINLKLLMATNSQEAIGKINRELNLLEALRKQIEAKK